MAPGLRTITLTLIILAIVVVSVPVQGWSNGGFSYSSLSPKYSTHDWIAEHALDNLPDEEKQYILDNKVLFLYATELPDNSDAMDGIGDYYNHHVYYSAGGIVLEDQAAVRAQEEYNRAVTFLKAGDGRMAAKCAGLMAHYIADLAVFGHVMGSGTAWGSEEHHSDYESNIRYETTTYRTRWDSYMVFDESLDRTNAYSAGLTMARMTTFGDGGKQMSCIWMDTHYNWMDPSFRDSTGASLNHAVNLLTDVLHTLAGEASYQANSTVTIEDTQPPVDEVEEIPDIVDVPKVNETIEIPTDIIEETVVKVNYRSVPYLITDDYYELDSVDESNDADIVIKVMILLVPIATIGLLLYNRKEK